MSPQKHPESCACDDCDRRECLRSFMRARAFLARKGLLAEVDAWVDGAPETSSDDTRSAGWASNRRKQAEAIREGMPEVAR